MGEQRKQTKADALASFIVDNWHFCPVDIEVEEKECDGWKSDKCKRCVCKNALTLTRI